ncbi:hypothetical protein AB8T55_05360 [Klebsiella pneumoniae subsp. ozaenae]
MDDKKLYLYLNAFLVKSEYASIKYSDFLKTSSQVNAYELDNKHELDGMLFIKKTGRKKSNMEGVH